MGKASVPSVISGLPAIDGGWIVCATCWIVVQISSPHATIDQAFLDNGTRLTGRIPAPDCIEDVCVEDWRIRPLPVNRSGLFSIFLVIARVTSFPIHPSIDIRNLFYPAPAIAVFQVHDIVVRPMEVVGDKGYLLGKLIKGVA